MDLRSEILKEHSKAQCSKIVIWVGNNQQRFDALFREFISDEYRVSQRAGWPLSNIVMLYPALIRKHWKALLSKLDKPGIHVAVKRNSIRLMQDIEIPKSYQGIVMDKCFSFLESADETLAVKVFSMTVLTNLAKKYPDIIPELLFLIKAQLPHQTAGFKSRAKQVLRQLGIT